MAINTAYLKKRRQSWYFQIAVPVDLQAKLGKKVIAQTLGTRDLTKAQSLRWSKLNEWTEAFERMRGNTPLSGAEIEGLAQDAFKGHLIEMDNLSKDLGLAPSAELEQLQQRLQLMADAIDNSDFTSANQKIQEIAERTGADVSASHRAHGILAKALLAAEYHAVLGRCAALQGRPYDRPATFATAVAIDPILLRPILPVRVASSRRNDPGLRFSDAAARYVDELQRDNNAKVTEQTRLQHEAVFRLFMQYTSDAPLADITGEIASGFLGTVAKLHPNWGRSPNTKQLSLRDLIAKHGDSEEHLSNRTLNRYVASLSGLFKWAKTRNHFAGQNPFADQSYAKPGIAGTIWLPYLTDELNRLMRGPLLLDTPAIDRIKPKLHTVKNALTWMPLMALFTGMRSGELCQLHADDLFEEHGIKYFRIHAERDGQRLKTEAAVRHVPVHSTLIKCGLLDYVAMLPKGQLFPALKPGGPDGKLNWYFTKRFTDYRRSVGIDRRRVSFHSLRKNAAQALKNARTTPAEIAELIGHERGFTIETYAPLGLPLAVLQELIERIQYPEVQFDHLVVSPNAHCSARTTASVDMAGTVMSDAS